MVLLRVCSLLVFPMAFLMWMIEMDRNFVGNLVQPPLYQPTKSYFHKREYYVVPHSHNDPGWVATFSESVNWADSQTEGILEHFQTENDSFTFTLSDIIFFAAMDTSVHGELMGIKEAVAQKKINLVNCGFSMPDQSLTHYDDLINIFEYGREYCQKKFNYLPSIGWSIDPFGHSSYISRLYAELGYSAQVMNRIPYYQKAMMKRHKQMLFNWKGKNPEDDMPSYLTHMHYNSPPRKFNPNWRVVSDSFDLLEGMMGFMMHCESMAQDYTANKSIIFFGDDFVYIDFKKEFMIHEPLRIASLSNMQTFFANSSMQYSSFQQYLKDLRPLTPSLPEHTGGDFLPLVEGFHGVADAVWTGFYFLRPAFKQTAKRFGILLRSLVEALAVAQLRSESRESLKYQQFEAVLNEAKITQGLMTHHDAVTGTAALYVIKDYSTIVHETVKKLEAGFSRMLGIPDGQLMLGQETIADPTASIVSVVAINGANRVRKSISVNFKNCIDPKKVRINPPAQGLRSVIVLIDKLKGCRVTWRDKKPFDPFERRAYSVEIDMDGSQTGDDWNDVIRSEITFGESIAISKNYTAILNREGLEITGKIEGKLNLSLWTYHEKPSKVPKNFVKRVGPYIMRTDSSSPDIFTFNKASITAIGWTAVVSLEQTAYPYTVLHLICNPSETSPFKVIFGIDKLFLPYGIDYVMRLTFENNQKDGNNPVFFTDSNGQDTIQREFRKDRAVELSYEPFASFISIPLKTKSGYKAVSVVSDVPSGGTSPAHGIIEIGVARNNLGKDKYGIHEAAVDCFNVTYSEFQVVLEQGYHSDIKKALPAFQTRQYQLEKDTSFILLNTPKFQPSMTMPGSPYSEQLAKVLKAHDPCPVDLDPNQLIRLNLDAREDGTMVRIFNLQEHCSVTISDLTLFVKNRLGLTSQINLQETSLDFLRSADESAKGDEYLLISSRARETALAESRMEGGVVLRPLKYKTFKLTIL